MDDRRTHDRTGRRAALVLTGLLAVTTLVLGACGGSGGDGASSVHTSDVDDPAGPATTTGAEATTSRPEGDGGSSEVGNPDCGLLAGYLLEPAQLSEADGGEPRPERRSTEEEVELAASIQDELPPDLASRWADFVAAIEREVDGEMVSDAEAQDLVPVYDAVIVWSAWTCPDVSPAWKCAVQAKFEQVGQAIGDDGSGTTDEDGPADDPDEVLAGYQDADDAVVLDESETAVLWGWLDDDGLVIRSEQASKVGEGWVADGSVSCDGQGAFSGGDEGFDPVGEPIDGSTGN